MGSPCRRPLPYPQRMARHAAERRSLRIRGAIFGGICPVRCSDTERSHAYVLYMLSTLLVIGGVLVGLFVLLALIVSLSARPQTAARGSAAGGRGALLGRGRRASPPGRVVAAVHDEHQRDPRGPLSPLLRGIGD